jgi:hypothetical protein
VNDDFLNQIGITLKPYSDLADQIAATLRPKVIAIEEAMKLFEPAMQQLSTAFQLWLKKNAYIFEAIKKYAEQAKRWQMQQKQDVLVMAQRGWFPNWFTFFFRPEKKVTDIDALMAMHLNDCWGDITEKIIDLCPDRKHILKIAFELHQAGNYVASIPLFISQADGIFCEEIKTFLFAGEKPKEILGKMLETGDLQSGFFEDILIEPYKITTQFSEGVRKSTEKDKKKAPNRSGILHGHRKHLDYGTELNSLKSFSLLAFVVFSVKDIFKNQIKANPANAKKRCR